MAYTPSAATQEMKEFMDAAFGTTSDEDMSRMSLSPTTTQEGYNMCASSSSSSTAHPPDLSSIPPTPKNTRSRQNQPPPTDLSKYSICEGNVTSPQLSPNSNLLVCRLIKYGGLQQNTAQAVAFNLAEKRRSGKLRRSYANASKGMVPPSQSPGSSPLRGCDRRKSAPSQTSTFICSDDDDFQSIQYVA